MIIIKILLAFHGRDFLLFGELALVGDFSMQFKTGELF